MTTYRVTAAAASTINSASYAADYAFNGVVSSAASQRWASASSGGVGWLRADLGTAKVADFYSIAAGGFSATQDPKDWTFEGSNDASSWTVLDTRTAQTFSGLVPKSFSFTNSTAYRYYRLNITANGGNAVVSVSEMSVGGAGASASIVEQDTLNIDSVTSATIAISSTPTADQVVVVSIVSNRTDDSVSGLGATWTKVHQITMPGAGAHSVWRGVGATASGNITLTAGSSPAWVGQANAFLLDGSDGVFVASATHTTGVATAYDNGQLALSVVYEADFGTPTLDTTNTTPSHSTWTMSAMHTAADTTRAAWRLTDAAGTYKGQWTGLDFAGANTVMLGMPAPEGAVTTTGAVAATLPALTASAAGTVATPPITGDVAATLPALSASVEGTVTEPPATVTGDVAATLPALTASVTGTVAGASTDVTGTVSATLPSLSAAATVDVGDAAESIGFGFGFGMRITDRRTTTADARTNLPQYRLVAVDMYGTQLAELHKASMTPIEDEVNGAGGFSFTVGSNDPKARNVMPRHGYPPPEVQVWRGDVLVGWYVVKTARPTGLGLYTFDCVGLRWYYSKRFIDRRPRRFLFRNGTFGSMFMWWDRLTPAGTVTASIVASDRGIDGRAVRLENAGVNLYGRSGPTARHLRQRRRITQPTSLQSPLPIRATVDMRVVSFTAASLLGYGVKLSAVNVNDIATVIDSDEVELSASYMIDEDTPRDRWHEVTLEIDIPANGIEHIVELRLVPPGAGIAEFTNIDVSPAEQLAYYDDDQAWIVGNLSDNAQDSQWGKASLNIGRHTPLTGVLRSREYEFAEHKPYLDAMNEYPALYNGVEWDVTTTATTRTLTTFYPRQGSASDAVLALGSNVVDYDATVDLDEVSNSVVVQGLTLGGSDRKERHALDAGSMGGAILEGVVMADGETPLPELDEAAAQVLAEMGSPAPPLRVTCHPRYTSDLLDRLRKGDTCRAIIGDGLLDVDETRRAVRRTLDPNTDMLTYDLTWEA